MEKLFISPSKYAQGEGLLKNSASYIRELGKHLLLLTDDFVWTLMGEEYAQALKKEGFTVHPVVFKGEASEQEIERLFEEIREKEVEVLVALGGGKVIDTGKSLADRGQLSVVIIPTTASTDAPTSSVSVLYEEDGRFKKYSFYQKNPELVLVDTAVIVNAPPRFLAAGIADGLSTAVEARAVSRAAGHNILGKSQTLTALAIAEKCEEILFEYGLQAMRDNQEKKVTAAFEAVVEANTLMSGLGFESGGLSAAHALHNGFSALPGKGNQLMHGEKVAYTTLIQLVLEGAESERLQKFITFFHQLALPTTCQELSLDLTDEQEMIRFAEQALAKGDSMKEMPEQITSQKIIEAVRHLEQFIQVNNPNEEQK